MCPLPDVELKHYEEMIRTFQEKAYRVIGFAHKTLDQIPADFEASRTSVESGMIFDGFAAIADPLRKEVFEAVRNCRDAGIDIKMLTGDNIVTASAIARELQLLGDDHIAVEARDINDISDKELAAMLPKIRVIARSTPVIKMRVVKLLKELGAVVAVTGDQLFRFRFGKFRLFLKNCNVPVKKGLPPQSFTKSATVFAQLGRKNARLPGSPKCSLMAAYFLSKSMVPIPAVFINRVSFCCRFSW